MNDIENQLNYIQLQTLAKENGLRANLSKKVLLKDLKMLKNGKLPPIEHFLKDEQETVLKKHRKKIIGSVATAIMIVAALFFIH